MRNIFTISLLLIVQMASSQTIQFKMCGKNSKVLPTNDANGNDQRHKGQITLDKIRLGIIGNSLSNPFYIMGDPSASFPTTFANDVFVQGCDNNSNFFNCNACSKCISPYYGNYINAGQMEGKMLGNFRAMGSNNNLLIQSVGDTSVVCYVSKPVDVSAYKNKKLEITVNYSGNSTDGFSTKNISFHYQYNNSGWPARGQLFNKNSNNTETYEDTYGIDFVPNAVEDLTDISAIEINPNPVLDLINLKVEISKAFTGQLYIVDELGNESFIENKNFQPGAHSIQVPTNSLSSGMYFLKISDTSGKIKTAKFTKL